MVQKIAYLENTDVTFEEINQIIKGPDFPTGGTIIGIKGIKDSQSSGRGSIIVQAKSNIEEFKTDREAIVFTEVPYQVNKSSLLEKIAELVRDKKIDGISDLRDESDLPRPLRPLPATRSSRGATAAPS